jgi:Cof subfamily protein (haloacid dehalogenase superfamily)
MALPSIVATDLDGTLLRSDGAPSARTVAALRAAGLQGAAVVAVTGRPPRWVEDIHERFGVASLVVCMNGALVIDLATGEELAHAPFAPGIAAELAAALREAVPAAVFAVQDRGAFGREPGYVPIVERPGDGVAPVHELAAGNVTKLIVRHDAIGHDALVAIARRVVGARAAVTFSGGRIVELSAPGVHKAHGLAVAARLLGRDPADSIAFGDAPNDVEMLVAAGHGVAMANAHPEVLAVADEVAPANDEDGVAVVLERLLRG